MSLLNNNIKQDQLIQQGYCTMPWLEEGAVRKLLKLYRDNTNEQKTGFHPTMFHNDLSYRRLLNDAIFQALQEKMQQYFGDDYELLYGNFMVKEPGASSEMKLHQDWSYVEESSNNSYAIWIPLVDLNESNGMFSVIPNSHKINNPVRGPGTFCPYAEHSQILIEKYGVGLPLRKGEAVIWDHRLAHYSPANFSNVPRIAITGIITPKNRDVIHYYKAPENDKISKYRVDGNFYVNYTLGAKPNAEAQEELDLSNRHYTFEEIERIIQ